MTRSTLLLALLALAPLTSLSQTAPSSTAPTAAAPTRPLAFDVISIKPNVGGTSTNDQGMMRSMVMMRPMPDGFTASNVTPRLLISNAYSVKEDRISGGPDWISSASYDINAKVTSFDPPDAHQLTKDQRSQMLQSLLADRFKLVVHTETKEATVYALTVGKGGPKIKPSDPSAAPPAPPANLPSGGAVIRQSDSPAPGAPGLPRGGIRMMMNAGQFTLSGSASMAQLVDFLSQQLHTTVVDQTGLTGSFDIKLQFAPENSPSADSSDSSAPSIFTAIGEQLGLKLTSTKGPVQSIVIDSISRPTEN